MLKIFLGFYTLLQLLLIAARTHFVFVNQEPLCQRLWGAQTPQRTRKAGKPATTQLEVYFIFSCVLILPASDIFTCYGRKLPKICSSV